MKARPAEPRACGCGSQIRQAVHRPKEHPLLPPQEGGPTRGDTLRVRIPSTRLCSPDLPRSLITSCTQHVEEDESELNEMASRIESLEETVETVRSASATHTKLLEELMEEMRKLTAAK